MKRILVIHTGGTFGMVPTAPDEILAPGNIQNQLLTHVPEIEKIARIDVKIPFNMDSSDIGVKEWNAILQLIIDSYHSYDGIVIIHGTDTMVYTASALSFSLQQLQKPVVLTGSQRPLYHLRNDARSNLIDAIELATMDIPEVVIVFGQTILRGNRAKKISTTSYDAFESPNYPPLGSLDLKIHLNNAFIYPSRRKLKVLSGFETKASAIHILPSTHPDYFLPLLDTGLRAIILLAFGAGNLPEFSPNWLPFIEEALQKDIAIFIGSQSIHGATDLKLYESGQKALKAGAEQLGEMTSEAAYVKLLKVLSIAQSKEEIYQKFFENWAGEF
ncbi:MAG: asparaginase [Caldithrix sp.]|nr:asparaginase [Caldithrix sp.]